jgi:hypothetical protein
LQSLVAVFSFLALLVPILVSTLLTAANRFKPRHKWILLRGTAEVIKKEIFHYRAGVRAYGENVGLSSPLTEETAGSKSRDGAFAEKISTITRRLMQTEVNTVDLNYRGALPPPFAVAPGDDGFSSLTPERYIKLRLEDQLNYYRGRTKKLAWQTFAYQSLIIIVGAVGTLLAALGARLWIAATTAVITALSAWVGNFQIDHTLTKYNQAAADLSNLRLWWDTLTAEEKLINKDNLVIKCEEILGSEQTGWVQQMEDVMEDVRAAADEKKK